MRYKRILQRIGYKVNKYIHDISQYTNTKAY
jgi:hypothetical protein